MIKPLSKTVAASVARAIFVHWGNLDLQTQWHHHPEVELLYIKEGQVNAVLGENFHFFQAGTLGIVGTNLPHALQANREYETENPNHSPLGLVLKFREDFLGEPFFRKPELSRVQSMLQQARRGIRFSRAAIRNVSQQLEDIHRLSEPRKLVALLDILVTLSEQNDYEFLTPPGYQYTLCQTEDRMRDINRYVYDHFKEAISIREIASVANMTETSFCRYFKTRMQKSFSQYLNEVRISYACNLLQLTTCSVTEVCFRSGFNALPHFTRQFKKIMNTTPQQFQRMKKLLPEQALVH